MLAIGAALAVTAWHRREQARLAESKASVSQAERSPEQPTEVAEIEESDRRLRTEEWVQRFWLNAAREMQSSNPPRALELAQKIGDVVVRRSLQRSLESSWAQRDPASALPWLCGAKDCLLSDDEICAAAKAYASTDPIAAMECLVALVRSDELINETLPAIFSRWVEEAPLKAAKAVEFLPDDETRQIAIKSVAKTWIRKDPASAYIWLKGLPEFDRLIAELPSG